MKIIAIYRLKFSSARTPFLFSNTLVGNGTAKTCYCTCLCTNQDKGGINWRKPCLLTGLISLLTGKTFPCGSGIIKLSFTKKI
jgi:hypothetical protein